MTVLEKFENYHKNNPSVYEKFVEYARLIKSTGLKRYSIWAVANRVRWHYSFEVTGDEFFKISNDYLAYYARLIMQKEPDLKDFFKIKAMKNGSDTLKITG